MRNPLRLPLSLVFGAGLSLASVSANTILVDFGMTAGHAQGSPTSSPDANGVYWNNATSATHGGNISGGNIATSPGQILANLVTTTNAATSVSLQFSTNTGSGSAATDQQWLSAGRANGGLLGSNSGLQIDGYTIGIQTATEDYFFAEWGPSTITISGLDVNSIYKLSMFATRENTQARTSHYIITDRNGTYERFLQTSGVGIGSGGYNGNNDTIVSVPDLVPNLDGTITFVLEGSGPNPQFGYIGVLGITQVPEPASALLAGLGGLMLLSRRSRSAR